MPFFKTLGGVALAAAGLSLAGMPASADPIGDFYGGKTIKLIVSSAPGGGYDAYGRTFARHFGKHLAGDPTIVVVNMPGAGGVVAANYIYNVAPQDGTIIGEIQRTVPMVQIMGHKGPEYDPIKFNWLGSLSNEVVVIGVLKSAPAKTFDDVFKHTVMMGTTGPTDSMIYPALMDNTMGAKFHLVLGYPSATFVRLAMKRAEVQGISQSWSSFRAGWGKAVKSGQVRILMQFSLKPLPQLTKMGVPFIFDYLKDHPVLPGFTKDQVETYLRVLLTANAMGRPFLVGPKVPEERVKALRAAFLATANDPAFVKDAESQGHDVDPITGDDVQDMVRQVATTPKDMLHKVDALVQYKGPVKRVSIKLMTQTGPVKELQDGNRVIVISSDKGPVKAKISGSRTKIKVDGKKTKRDALKVGMTCAVTDTGPGSEAVKVACKS